MPEDLGAAEPGQVEGEPASGVQGDHAPGLGHDAAVLAFNADGLAEHANVGGQQCHDGGPVAAVERAQAAMGDAGENQHVGEAVGEIVEDFAAPARLVGSDGDHAIKHVEPQAQIAEQRSGDQQPGVTAGLPEANSRPGGNDDRCVGYDVGMDIGLGAKSHGWAGGPSKDVGDGPPRCGLVFAGGSIGGQADLEYTPAVGTGQNWPNWARS